jgi:hypothetical protein
MFIKEEVREDLYMQAGLQVPYCCLLLFVIAAFVVGCRARSA